MSATVSSPTSESSPAVPLVAVVGATAAGKTALSLDLAERLGGEIVNTDAMQLYRGMDIGTAKLPESQRRGIPHHLIDVLDVTHPATVAEFQERARAVIAGLRAAGRTPVLVGGSALYTRALLDRLHARNGQTLGELCEGLAMSRQAVTKHLGILEQANLIATRKEGREKLHFINPVPIAEIADRWIRKFERPQLDALAALKRDLEGERE